MRRRPLPLLRRALGVLAMTTVAGGACLAAYHLTVAPLLVEADDQSGGELTLAASRPSIMDPGVLGDSNSIRVASQVFRGLVAQTAQQRVRPELAERWAMSADGLNYEFKLRPTATFHNGKPVTSADFLFSLDRAADPKTKSNGAGTYLLDIAGAAERMDGTAKAVAGVDAPDPQTLRIRLAAPAVQFLLKMTYPTAAPVDKESLIATDPAVKWNGTGPFRLAEFNAGRTRLERFGGYVGGAAKLQRITYQHAGDLSVAGYVAGEFDVLPIGGVAARTLVARSGLSGELMSAPSMETRYIAFNHTAPPFNDARVRQAFAAAIDYPVLFDAYSRAGIRPARGLVAPGLRGFETAAGLPSFNPERGRALLKDAGFDAEKTPVTLPVFTLSDPLPFALAAWWNQHLGVPVKLVGLSFGDLRAAIRAKRVSAFGSGWLADYPDPQTFLDSLYRTDAADNTGGYSNPAVDALLDKAKQEPDDRRRTGLYRDAEQLLLDDVAAIPVSHDDTSILVRPWVSDYQVLYTGIDELTQVRTATAFMPVPSDPARGAVLGGQQVNLTWINPVGTQQVQVQVTPFTLTRNGVPDGPSVNLTRGATTSLNLGGANDFSLLPDMTYSWRVRISRDAAGGAATRWGPWSDTSTFRTGTVTSDAVALVQPDNGSTVARGVRTLQWTDTNPSVFLYDVQISTDRGFGEKGAAAPVWSNVVHGGLTTPKRSWTTPPLSGSSTYYWRVRPHVQGDGRPVTWGQAWSFTTQPRVLTPLPSGRIAFVEGAGGGSAVKVIETDGSARRISGLPSSLINASLSPDGTRLAVVERGGKLTVTALDGAARPITVATDVGTLSTLGSPPVWSPDGRTLAYTYQEVSEDEESVNFGISLVPADASAAATRPAWGTKALMPVFSPDNRWLAAINVEGQEATRLLRVNLATGEVTPVLREQGLMLSPMFTPDGQTLGFLCISDRSTCLGGYAVNLDGTNRRRIAMAPFRWSPDGKRMTYATTLGVYVNDAEGEGIEVNVAGNLQARRMSAALWSPDSSRLVFAALYAESFADIFMVNQDGTDLHDLTDGPGVKVPFGWGTGAAPQAALAGEQAVTGLADCGCDTEGLTRVLAGDAQATQALWRWVNQLWPELQWRPTMLAADALEPTGPASLPRGR